VQERKYGFVSVKVFKKKIINELQQIVKQDIQYKIGRNVRLWQ